MVRRRIAHIIGVCLVLSGSEVAAQALLSAVKPADAVVCRPDATTVFPREIEKTCLPKMKGIVTRASDTTLRIALANGNHKTFKGTPETCAYRESTKLCLYYVLKSYHPQNDAVVIERRVDGPTEFLLGAYMVERATGKVIDLPAEPHFSPDGSRFVSVSACHDHCANKIDVWSVHDGAAKLDWRRRVKQGDPSAWYDFVSWAGNDLVKLRVYPEEDREGDAGKATVEARAVDAKLERTGEGWQLEVPAIR